jgi:hypothetical protein
MNPRLSMFLAMALLLSGCGSTSGSNALQKSVQTIQSWTATAHTVADEWNNGDVPTAYAAQTMDDASQALQQQKDLLANSSSVPPDQRVQVTNPIPPLLQTIDRLAEAIRRGDHAIVTAQAQQLANQEQSLDDLAKQMGINQ